jgi:hypothetical protein
MKVFSLVRPVTGLTASWSLLICPEELGEPSKTGEFDVSLLLDSPYLSSWMSKVLPVFKDRTEPLAIQLQSVPVGLQEVCQPAGPGGMPGTVARQ